METWCIVYRDVCSGLGFRVILLAVNMYWKEEMER